jgi:hypothetical protein
MGDNTTQPRRARVDDIITLAARIWKIDRADLLGKSRIQWHSRARQAVFLVSREHGHSFPQIGRRLNRKDHTTVIHGCRYAEAVARIDPAYRERVELLRQQALEAEAFIARPVKYIEPPAPVVIAKPKTKPRNVFANDDKGFQWHSLEQSKHRKQDIAFIAALNAAGGHARRMMEAA